MRILVLYARDFLLRPSVPGSEEAEAEPPSELAAAEAVVALVHAEPHDAGREGKVVTKAIKNLKWVAGKFGARRVVLHYFAHLGRVTAPPELARELVGRMAERLEGAGYEAPVTPFGWFTEFRLDVAGDSLAKVWVEL